MTTLETTVRLRRPHLKQNNFIASNVKRKVIRAGRRSGKTVGVGVLAVQAFLNRRRVLYATPTTDQITRFWFEVKRALQEPLDAGVFHKNETEHVIERATTETRIKAKTAWNADTLRGDYADLLILDEWQLMDEDAWGLVGAPMLLDNNGDAVFVYTPPSVHSRRMSKAKDKLHASKLFKRALADTSGRWSAFHFTSHDNPYLSKEALAEITGDMTRLAYEQEILAEDKEDNPNALWTRDMIEGLRVSTMPALSRIVTAIDPNASDNEMSDEIGIVTAGIGLCDCLGQAEIHGFLLADDSLARGSPEQWASQGVASYRKHRASRIIGEANNGGNMIETIIRVIDPTVAYKEVHASQGKYARAEPVAALCEKHKLHFVGAFGDLEDELCMWSPLSGARSPGRLDAMVWAVTDLMLKGQGTSLLFAV